MLTYMGSEDRSAQDVRVDCRPARRPRHGEILRRRAHRPQRASVGRDRAFSGRCLSRGGGARHGCDLCRRTAWRERHDSARRGADLRGSVDRLPVRRFVPVHPQHGGVGRRRLRLGGAQKPLSAAPRHDGAHRQLLPHRARRGLRRRGADHARKGRTAATTCSTASSSSSPAPAQATSISSWRAPARGGRAGFPPSSSRRTRRA